MIFFKEVRGGENGTCQLRGGAAFIGNQTQTIKGSESTKMYKSDWRGPPERRGGGGGEWESRVGERKKGNSLLPGMNRRTKKGETAGWHF